MDDKLSTRECLVLSTIKFRERSGWEIIKALKEDAGSRIHLGVLYTLLTGLEKKGYITSHWGENLPDRAGARRRYYRITGLGERVSVATTATAPGTAEAYA